MGKFRVGLTRDFLNENRELKFAIDISELEQDPLIECRYFDEHYDVVRPEQLEGFDAVISLSPKYTAESFRGVDRLIAIARCGVGYDVVDTQACTDADVMCFVTPGGVRRPVATSILGFMFALSSRLFVKDRLAREGRWNERIAHMGEGLTGKVVGSVGLGGIAQEFFAIAKPLGIVPIAYDPFVSQEAAERLGVELVSLETLLDRSDYVCINCPLNHNTRGLIGEKELGLMKPSAYLINTSRGGIVDERALIEALQRKRIQGAALDVFESEPLGADNPLTKLNNVVLAPHAIAWTDELFREMSREDVAGILRIAQGRVPANVVNREVLEKPAFKRKLEQFKAANNE